MNARPSLAGVIARALSALHAACVAAQLPLMRASARWTLRARRKGHR